MNTLYLSRYKEMTTKSSGDVRSPVPPDGGWGWKVVFGAALTNMMNQSVMSVFGLLYGDEMKRMGSGTVGIALVVNLASTVTNLSGVFTGPCLKRWSARTMSMSGVVLTSGGLVMSSFATEPWHLMISFGLLTGLGLGLIMPSTFVAVNSYFKGRRSQAVGLSMAGTGIGQMLMPQVVRFLLDEYGYRGATLIMGALSLQGLAGSLLFHPVEWHAKLPPGDVECERTGLLRRINIPTATPATSKVKTMTTTSTPITEIKTRDERTPGKGSACRKLAKVLNLELLKDPVFVHIIIGLSTVYTSGVAFNMLLPFYLQDGIGLSRAETALSMSLLSAADIVARLTIPLMATRLQLGNRITFLYGTVMLALCRSLLAMQETERMVLGASVLCGYIRAITVINQNLTVSEHCDEKKLPAALGLAMLVKGFVVLTLGQFFGWIRDYTDSFSVCIHTQSVFLATVAFTWALEIAARRVLQHRQGADIQSR